MAPKHHFLPYEGGRLHVLEWPSSGPTIVCQHYMWTTADVWADLHGALGGRYRVLSVDAPGHGGSDPLDPEDPARTMRHVMDTLVDGPAYVVGASNGARRCTFFALRHPERVRKLVFTELPILAPPTARDEERQRMASLPPAMRSFDELFEAYRKHIYPKADRVLLRQFLERNCAPVDGLWRTRTTIDEIPELLSDVDLTPPAFRGLSMPVLIVYGENSRLCGHAGAELLQAQIADSRVIGLPGCGHIVHLNQPDRLHAAIGAFFEER